MCEIDKGGIRWPVGLAVDAQSARHHAGAHEACRCDHVDATAAHCVSTWHDGERRLADEAFKADGTLLSRRRRRCCGWRRLSRWRRRWGGRLGLLGLLGRRPGLGRARLFGSRRPGLGFGALRRGAGRPPGGGVAHGGGCMLFQTGDHCSGKAMRHSVLTGILTSQKVL